MPQPLTAANIQKIFDPYYKADVTAWDGFASKLTERHFNKNEIIKAFDTTEKYLNILISGTAGLFIWNGKNEICLNLFYENDFFGDYLSFLKQEKTPLQTLALEDLTLWSITYTDLNIFYNKSILGAQMARIAAERLYAQKQQEQVNLLTLSPEERYLKLINERPQIIQRTSLKYVASYLGITSESLSRLRKRIVLK
jgi:CRP-like cAMP-binding protein